MKEQLQQLRRSKGITQEEAADIFEVSLSSYQKYERDAISPSYDTLIKIADFYGVTTDFLLGRDNGSPLDEYAGTVNMSVLEREIIDGYFNLGDDTRKKFMDMLETAVKEVAAKSPVRWKAASSADDHGSEVTELTSDEQQRLDNTADETKNDDNDL